MHCQGWIGPGTTWTWSDEFGMKHCPRAVVIARPSTLQLTALPSELAAGPAALMRSEGSKQCCRQIEYKASQHIIWIKHSARYTPSQWGNYHHSMFHNPTAAVNLFHVGKQYLAFCKAEAAVTHNVIGRKIISNVKHSDARNSLPILDVIRSSHKRDIAPQCVRVLQMNATSNDRCLL